MSSLAISAIVFACVFGGALLGLLLRRALPTDHRSAETKEAVKLGTGLVGTMAALVLGLLVASAKGSYDAQSTEQTQLAANVVLVDRVLAHYGPESTAARGQLQAAAERMLEQMWPTDAHSGSVSAAPGGSEGLYETLQQLAPSTPEQHALQAQALQLAVEVGKTRWLMYAQSAGAVSLPLLVMLVLWLSVIFVSFGLFAPPNATVIGSLAISALSVSGAIFLILELYSPYVGMIRVSSAPLRAALAHLGQ